MSTRPIAITGSTGKLGGRIARRIAETGTPQRLLVRDPSRAPDLPASDAVTASYGDGAAVRAALEGIDTALMVSGSESPDRLDQHRTFVDAAAAAGVRHLVYISFYGATPTATFTLARDHYETEQHIRGTGMAFTFLRDCFYADFMPDLVGDDGVIRGPAGNGRVAVVAQDDIADAATAVLLNPTSRAGQTFSLTGRESLTLHEVAEIVGRETGRAVSYHPETVAEAYESRAAFGAPSWQLDAWVSTYTAIAAGEVADVTDDVARLTGHPPISLAQLLRSRPS